MPCHAMLCAALRRRRQRRWAPSSTAIRPRIEPRTFTSRSLARARPELKVPRSMRASAQTWARTNSTSSSWCRRASPSSCGGSAASKRSWRTLSESRTRDLLIHAPADRRFTVRLSLQVLRGGGQVAAGRPGGGQPAHNCSRRGVLRYQLAAAAMRHAGPTVSRGGIAFHAPPDRRGRGACAPTDARYTVFLLHSCMAFPRSSEDTPCAGTASAARHVIFLNSRARAQLSTLDELDRDCDRVGLESARLIVACCQPAGT